jgi:hypothetical protein
VTNDTRALRFVLVVDYDGNDGNAGRNPEKESAVQVRADHVAMGYVTVK